MYRSPDLPFSQASQWPSATSRMWTTFRPVSIYAGIAPVEKIEHDLAGGRGLEIAIAHGRGGIDDDDRKTGAREIERYLLGEKFGSLVSARHFMERNGIVLVADAAARNADTADGAGVDEPFDTGRFGGREHVAGAVDIGLVHLFGVPGPETIIGRDMEDEAAAGDGALERGGVPQITGDAFDIKIGNAAGGTHQRAHTMAAFEQ